MTAPASNALPPGFRIAVHGEVDSTNDLARAAADAGETNLVIVATSQRKGRGRHGRSWYSPPGNLYCSLLIEPGVGYDAAASLSLVIALSLAEAVEAEASCSLPIKLKWPNDVLVHGAKLAGILLEGHSRPLPAPPLVIAGVGVNLAHHASDTPYPVTSLAREGVNLAADRLLATFLRQFEAHLRLWRESTFAALRPAWLARAAGLGKQATVRVGARTVRGRLVDVDDWGALHLETPDGGAERLMAGELFFSIPADGECGAA